VLVFESAGTITRVIGIAAFGVGALYVVATGRIRRLRLPHFAILAFVAWAILGFYWSVDADLTLARAWTYVQLAAMVWLIWQFARTRAEQRALLQAYVLGCFMAVVGTLANYVAGQQTDYLRYAATGFGPNDLGVILALGIPMGWYLSITGSTRRWVWGNRLYLPAAAVAIVLTSSRTAFIAALVAMLVIPWTMGRLSVRSRAALLVGVAACIVALYVVVPAASWQRIGTIPTEVTEGSLNLREDIWAAGLEVFSQRPIQGVGAGAFRETVAPALGKQKVAHNTFLSILTENGIIGFALFTFIVALCVWGTLKMPRTERRVWLVLMATWAVGAFFLSWEHRHPTWLLLGLLLAQALAFSDPVSRLAHSGRRLYALDAS